MISLPLYAHAGCSVFLAGEWRLLISGGWRFSFISLRMGYDTRIMHSDSSLAHEDFMTFAAGYSRCRKPKSATHHAHFRVRFLARTLDRWVYLWWFDLRCSPAHHTLSPSLRKRADIHGEADVLPIAAYVLLCHSTFSSFSRFRFSRASRIAYRI